MRLPDDLRPARVTVVRPRGLGDVVLSTAVLDALRRAWPDTRIDYIVERPSRTLLESDPRLDRIFLLGGPFCWFLKDRTYYADADLSGHFFSLDARRQDEGLLSSSSAQIGSGMERVLIAGGVQSLSMTPLMSQRIIGPELKFEERWMPPTHVETPDAPTKDMSITVGWNTAQAAGISREDMDAWAARSHQRAIAAIDAGKFLDEILPLKIQQQDGSVVDFSVDEHPRRDTTAEKLAQLKVLHPEIEGFSITAGNSSGTNDACAAVALVDRAYALDKDLDVMATVKAWAAVGVPPRDTGLGGVEVIGKVLDRAGLTPSDVALWEINEAFASVPIAACRKYGLDEELVNFSGSGCSLGHPIAASGARMVTTLVYELRRRGGGIGVAAMCAGGGQGGAVVIEV